MESPYPRPLCHGINPADCGGNNYSDNISGPGLLIVLQRTNSASIQPRLPDNGRDRGLNHSRSGNMTGGKVLL
jgi:hypothetical protein